VAGNGKRSTAEKEISEDSGAHAGCGVIIVARFGWDRGANAGRFDREGDNGAEVEWMMAGVVPPRRAGRKAIRISISMGTKCSTAEGGLGGRLDSGRKVGNAGCPLSHLGSDMGCFIRSRTNKAAQIFGYGGKLEAKVVKSRGGQSVP